MIGRGIWALAALLASAAAAQAQAQGFPNRPVRVVIPFSAGTVSDIAMRFIGERLAPRLGQQVIIDNQPGAGGIAAARATLAPAHDGHTVMNFASGTAGAVSLFRALPYDPVKDFVPVTGISDFGYVVVTNKDSRFKTLREAIAEAKAKPDGINVGTAAAGSTPYLIAEWLKIAAGIGFTIVPYRGAPDLLVATIRSDVDLMIDTYGSLRGEIADGRIRALATTSAARLPFLADVPTVIESGVADFDASSWNALFAPAGTPPEAIARLGRDIAAVLAEPEIQRKLSGLGALPNPLPPDALGARLKSDIARWGGIIREAKIPQQ